MQLFKIFLVSLFLCSGLSAKTSYEKQMSAIVQQKIKQDLATLYANNELPSIKKPIKPTIPNAKSLVKDEFETTKAFNARVRLARKQRVQTIKDLETKYYKQVQSYNQKIKYAKQQQEKSLDDYKQNLAQTKAKYALEAFKQVHGDIFLGKELKYHADSQQFFGELHSTQKTFHKKVVIKMPLKIAKTFRANINEAKPLITFDITDKAMNLQEINIAYKNKKYNAYITEGGVQLATMNVKVDITEGSLDTSSAKLLTTHLQINPQDMQIGEVQYDFDTKIANLSKKDFESIQQKHLETINENINDLPELLRKSKPSPKNQKAYAVIFGIEDYAFESRVAYSANSALMFMSYANKILGVEEENIWTFIGKSATAGSIKTQWQQFLSTLDDDATIYFYYSGHGVPSQTGEAFILPSDVGAGVIEQEKQFALKNIYADLSESKAKKVIAFIDSCFSGKDDTGEILFKGVAPILKIQKTTFDADKMTLFTAGTSKQFSNQYEGKEQRLFSYFLMKGLAQGKKDPQDLHRYIRTNVIKVSKKLGERYLQTPQIEGNIRRGI